MTKTTTIRGWPALVIFVLIPLGLIDVIERMIEVVS